MPERRRLRGWLAVVITSLLLGGGVARAQSAVPEAQLETFLGLNPPSGLNSGDLTNLGNGPVIDGSAIKQTINVSAGATLTFDYNFLTNAPPPGTGAGGLLGAIDPFAFITVPTLTDFADNYFGFPMPMGSAPSSTGFMYQSGYRPFSETFANAGTYTLGLGVANVTTDAYSSGLLIDNMVLSGGTLDNGLFSTGSFTGFSTIGDTSIQTSGFGINPTNGPYQALITASSVPEPSSVLLLLTGGLGAAVVIRRKARSAATPRAA